MFVPSLKTASKFTKPECGTVRLLVNLDFSSIACNVKCRIFWNAPLQFVLRSRHVRSPFDESAKMAFGTGGRRETAHQSPHRPQRGGLQMSTATVSRHSNAVQCPLSGRPGCRLSSSSVLAGVPSRAVAFTCPLPS